MEHEHDPEQDQEMESLEVRIIGFMTTTIGEDDIAVDHVFTLESQECSGCGTEHEDEGFVGLMINDEDSEENYAGVLLTAAEALFLANRLKRAAEVILEANEDLPNPEREYRRRVNSGGPE